MGSSFIIGLIAGCLTGSLGLYYLQNVSFNRKKGEIKKNKINELKLLFDTYPAFMNNVKNDLSDPEFKNIREFFVVEKIALMNSAVPRLRYDLSEEILPALAKMEELGFIERLPNNSLLYKMHQDLVAHLNTL
jgi:hypothetical protein